MTGAGAPAGLPGPPGPPPVPPAAPPRFARVRGLAVDVRPLREHSAYRWLWTGQVVSVVGSQLTAVAVPLQVYALTRSSFLVGLAGLVALVPTVVFGLYGGAIADAGDRRRLLLLVTVAEATASAVLTAQAAVGHVHLAVLYACTGWQAAFAAVDNPARRAVVPRLVKPGLLPAANALTQVVWNLGQVTGPLLAGLLVGTVGYAAAYGLDTLSFAAAFWGVLRLPALPPEHGGTRADLRSVLDGLRYLRRQPLVLVGLSADLAAMTFAMPRALFPALALHRFHGGAGIAGLLFAAPAAGALLAAVASGWLGSVSRHGRAVLAAVAVWGLAMTGFGIAPWLGVGLALLAVAGAADMVSAVYRTTIMQSVTPDEMMGRLAGAYTVVVAGGPRIGDVESGAMASALGAGPAVVVGGLLSVAATLTLGLASPRFRRYDARRTVAGAGTVADVSGQPASTPATTRRSSTKPL